MKQRSERTSKDSRTWGRAEGIEIEEVRLRDSTSGSQVALTRARLPAGAETCRAPGLSTVVSQVMASRMKPRASELSMLGSMLNTDVAHELAGE